MSADASSPPNLPPTVQKDRQSKILFRISLWVSAAGMITLLGLVSLRVTGLLRPFGVPTAGMSPAISPGDQILMEKFTFLSRKPARGDIVIFDTSTVPGIEPSSGIWAQRIGGLPGDTLRIADGKLYVNGTNAPLSNSAGEIHYLNDPRSLFLGLTNKTIQVSNGCYFVLGDNSSNSLDGRYWGLLSEKSILGRATYRYWPLARRGEIK